MKQDIKFMMDRMADTLLEAGESFEKDDITNVHLCMTKLRDNAWTVKELVHRIRLLDHKIQEKGIERRQAVCRQAKSITSALDEILDLL